MAGLTEKLGFAVTPSLNGTFGMRRKCTAAPTPKMFFLGLALWEKLADQEQGNDYRDGNAEDSFLRHLTTYD
jgi:hypothetical protein